jgi:myo-inositol-1-phosphate synthase
MTGVRTSRSGGRRERKRSERRRVRIAIVGVGNCASSLVQGTSFYRGAHPDRAVGLMHWEIGG